MSGICGLWQLGGSSAAEALPTLAWAAAYRGEPHPLGSGDLGLAALVGRAGGASSAQRPGYLSVAQCRLDNRDELVPSLRRHGVRPSSSDAELILAAYLQWGLEAPAKLIGDFAFALWDESQQRLFCARDPMAMRPLYYHHTAKRFAFASEIGQLLALPDTPRRINDTMVALYLAGRFDPLELTFYEDVKQLEPAHALLVTRSSVRTWRYWDVDPERRVRYRRDADYTEHFRELFLRAVRDRLTTDKPIGLFLSGGVDSGTLASSIGWLENAGVNIPEVHAVSFAFPSFPECDERGVSDLIADHYGFHKHTVDMDLHHPLAHYPKHGPHVDEPFIGAYQAALETGLECAQRLGVGLMMGGDRGDLLVGDALFDPLGMLASGRPRRSWQEFVSLRGWQTSPRKIALDYAVKPLVLGLRERFYRNVPDHPVTRTPAWLSPALMARAQLKDRLLKLPVAAPFGGVRGLRYELFFVPFHMRGVAWSERTQARFGLEFADAYSDRRLIEFILSVPQWAVQRTDLPKSIAQEAVARALPDAARGKLGKVVPTPLYEAALRERARSSVTTLLHEPRAEALGYLCGAPLRQGYERVLRGAGVPPDLWWMLTLEMWLRKHF